MTEKSPCRIAVQCAIPTISLFSLYYWGMNFPDQAESVALAICGWLSRVCESIGYVFHLVDWALDLLADQTVGLTTAMLGVCAWGWCVTRKLGAGNKARLLKHRMYAYGRWIVLTTFVLLFSQTRHLWFFFGLVIFLTGFLVSVVWMVEGARSASFLRRRRGLRR
jgi:threonine/homoserine/homoserine lactone efflux protein